MDGQEDLVTILFSENPICLPQILEGDDFVGVNKDNDIFKDLLM